MHSKLVTSRAWRRLAVVASVAVVLGANATTVATAADGWVATWATAQQGAWATPAAPAGLTPPGEFQATIYFTQPDAVRYALPDSTATDQTFRMIVRPDLWGTTVRFRFSNVFGTSPLVIGTADVGLQAVAAEIIGGTSVPITFGGKPGVSIAAGERVFSDPVTLGFVSDATRAVLAGRNLAVSFAISGSATALSHHGSAYTTSYIGAPKSGDHAADNSGDAFPYTTSSWFVLDAIDVMAPDETPVVVAIGDSITDGTLGTNNVNDRWPDVLASRLHAALGEHVSVVNEAINANATVVDMVGQSALKRLERDVLGVSGVKTVVLLEGINDLGAMGVTADALIDGYKQIVATLHAHHIRAVGGTITPALFPGDFALSTLGAQYGAGYGGAATDAARKVVNDFIRNSGLFDAVVDFDAAILDPATGSMRAEYAPNSMGGAGDYLHPNHGGYLAMGEAVDLKALLPAS
ncbi:MAG: GDSL-type esterase/lipase family protein [Devosia sp.]